MKKLLPLLVLFFSCTQERIAAPGQKHSVTMTGQKVFRAGGIFDLKLTITTTLADSATKIEVCHADFRVVTEIPRVEGQQQTYDTQINQFATQTTYIIRSYLLGGEVRYTPPITIYH